MAYHAEASPSDSRRDPAFGGGSNGDRPLEFTVPVYKLGGGDKSYTTQIIKTGSRESSREASYDSRILPSERAAAYGQDRWSQPPADNRPRAVSYSSRSLPRTGTDRYSASLADEMDGQDMHRTVHISSVPQRTTSPDQQIEVKITTKKAAAFPGDSATRKSDVFDTIQRGEREEAPVPAQRKEWVEVQKKTFTNWFRDRVRDNGCKPLTDIETDLEDGRLLIDLMRVLTEGARGRRTPHKNPGLRVQKIENINTALMIMKEERVPLVSIGAEDICDGNLKLILGMLWCLIIRYQIADISTTTRKVSAKKVLLQWMQAQLPHMGISNFTTNWNDGITLAALIDSLQPGLIPDWMTWSPDTPLENVARAMAVAEENFDIPQIIEPSDIAVSSPDELCIMTYLSYFCGPDSIGFHTLRNWVNSRIPQPHITNFSSDWKDGRALCALIDSFIPGQMPTAEEIQHLPPVQTVDQAMDFSKSRLGVDSNLTAEQFVNPDIDPLSVMTYISQYRSAKPKVDAADLVSVVGTGITGGSVGQEASFFIKHIPGDGKVTVSVVGPDGSDVEVRQRLTETGALQIFYTPHMPGTYTVTVKLNGKHIHGSPFKVTHHDVPQPGNCTLSGAGLHRAQVGQWAELQVDCLRAGPGALGVQIISPQGEIEHEVENKSDKVFGVRFAPMAVGDHQINLTWAGLHVPGGPYICQVSDPSRCIASGPGLSGGKLGQQTSFTVSTIGAGPGSLDTSIFGPSGTVPTSRNSNQEGEVTFSYTPEHQGSYLIDVKWDGFPIRGSPFKVRPAAAVDPSRVILVKPQSVVKAGQETGFLVNTKSAGHGVLKAEARGPHVTEKCQIFQEEDGVYSVTFTPSEVGKYEVDVTYGGGRVPQVPFNVEVRDPSRCVVDTQCIAGQTIRANETVVIPVSTKLAGDGTVTATARGPTGLYDLSATEMAAGFYNITFTPDVPGLHLLDIYFDGDPVLDDPIQVNVEPPSDIVFEKPPTVNGYYFTNELLEFIARTPDDDVTELKVNAYGSKTNSIPRISMGHVPGVGQVVQMMAFYPDDYRFEVFYGGQPISGSPFLLPVVTPPNPSAVICGDPIIPLLPNRPIEMAVDATMAGTGGLTHSVVGSVAGPVRVDSTMVAPSVYNVFFVPPMDDEYSLELLWAKESVRGSPFIIPYSREEDDLPVQVNIEPDEEGVGHLTASAMCRSTGEVLPVEVRQYERGKYRLSFAPTQPDLYDLRVEWNGAPLDDSPYELDCRGLEPQISSDSMDAALAKLTAEVFGETAGNVPVEVTPLEGGDYQISFVARQKETHEVNLYWQQRKIKGSPFDVDMRRRP